MSITAAIVLFSVTWFMVFFVVLPIRFESQADAGTVVPGTHRSAPSDPMLKRKVWITTGVTAVLFALMYVVITSGWVSIRDIDWRGTMGPERPEDAQPAD